MSLLLDLFYATVTIAGFIVAVTLITIIAESMIVSLEDWRKVK